MRPVGLFEAQKEAPEYLQKLHEDYIWKRVSFKEYKRLEKEFCRTYGKIPKQ